MSVCMYTFVYTHTYMHAYVCTYIRACTHAHFVPDASPVTLVHYIRLIC